jgi:hypothetical protein
LCPTSAAADVRAVGDFVQVTDFSGSAACLPGALGEEQLLGQVEESLAAADLDPDFAVVFTQEVLTCPEIFYVAVENDTQGIGYQYEDAELFDRAPETRLQGIAFLNDLPYWLKEREELQTAFLHETGHRWLARVHALAGNTPLDLTGRQGGHWSYFLDSGGSPLEGNLFLETPSPVVETPLFPTEYSALDLYLMGAMSPEEVGSFRLLLPDGSEPPLDCTGRPIGKSSPPQTCGALEISGTFVELMVEDVIAAEGARVPEAALAQKSFSVAFVLFDPNETMNRDVCLTLSEITGELTALFSSATRDRLSLLNLVEESGSCDSVPEEITVAPSGCSLSGPSKTRAASRSAHLVLALLALIAFVRRGSSRSPQAGRWGRARVARAVLVALLTSCLSGCGRTTDDPMAGPEAGGAPPVEADQIPCETCVVLDLTPRFDMAAGEWPADDEGGLVLVRVKEDGGVERTPLGAQGLEIVGQGWGLEHRWFAFLTADPDGNHAYYRAAFSGVGLEVLEIPLPHDGGQGTWTLDVTSRSGFVLLEFEEGDTGIKQLYLSEPAIAERRDPKLIVDEGFTSFQRVEYLESALVSLPSDQGRDDGPCQFQLIDLEAPSATSVVFTGACEATFSFGGSDGRWLSVEQFDGGAYLTRLFDAETFDIVASFADVAHPRPHVSPKSGRFAISIDRQVEMGDVSWTETQLFLGDAETGVILNPALHEGYPGSGISAGYKNFPCPIQSESFLIGSGGNYFEKALSEEPWVRLDAPPSAWAFCLDGEVGFANREQILVGESSFARPDDGELAMSAPAPWPGGFSFSLYDQGRTQFFIAQLGQGADGPARVIEGQGYAWSTIPFGEAGGGFVWQFERAAYWVVPGASPGEFVPLELAPRVRGAR